MNRGRVAVIGMGRLGNALVACFSKIGMSVQGFDRQIWRKASSHIKNQLESQDVLSLCVQDENLPGLVEKLSELNLHEKVVVIHSGTISLTALDVLATRGADLGKLHPLLAFSANKREPIPKGTHFAVSGSDRALDLFGQWIESWSGICHRLSPEQWMTYHLAAVLASNFLPLMIRAGASLLEPMARDSKDALAWLFPLIRSAVHDATNSKNPKPYSGPAVRGDWGVIKDHLDYLEIHDPRLALVYRSATHLLNAIANDNQKNRS